MRKPVPETLKHNFSSAVQARVLNMFESVNQEHSVQLSIIKALEHHRKLKIEISLVK